MNQSLGFGFPDHRPFIIERNWNSIQTISRQIKLTKPCHRHFVYVFISFQEVHHTSLIQKWFFGDQQLPECEGLSKLLIS